MKAGNKIKQLESEIQSLKIEQSNCKHKWENPIYDPEKIMVQDDREGYETKGVDRWPIPSFHNENKDRWSRECLLCGLKQYTYKNEIVSTKTEPKFNQP